MIRIAFSTLPLYLLATLKTRQVYLGLKEKNMQAFKIRLKPGVL